MEAAMCPWRPFRLCQVVPMMCTHDCVCFEVDFSYTDAFHTSALCAEAHFPVPHPLSSVGYLPWELSV